MTPETYFTHLAKNLFHKITQAYHVPLEAIALLLTARPNFGWHAKCSLDACKYLKNVHAANAACCMTPMFLAADAVDCTPHGQIYFYENRQNS